MKSTKRSLFKLSMLAAAFFSLIGVLVFGQESETAKTGVPDDWTHHHLIFSKPGTATQAISEGRFLDWYKTDADLRYRFQQLKRKAVAASSPQSTDASRADELAVPSPVAKSKKSTLTRDWAQLLGPAASTSVYVAPGTTGAIYEANPSSPSPTDYAVFGVAATPSGTQPNLVGINHLYNTTPSVLFAYSVGAGPVITSPTLGLSRGTVLYIESALSTNGGAKLHVLTGAGVSGSNGTVGSPVAPGAGNGALDIALPLSGSPTITYSSVFYDYGSDAAYVGDDNGYLHKFSPVFAAAPQEVLVPSGAIVWPAQIALTASKLTSPVLDPGSGRVWVSDGSKLYSVSPTYGGGTGSTIVASASLGTGIVDAPIVDGGNGFVYVFVGSVPEVAEFSTSGFPATTHTAAVGTGSTSISMYDGDFNNVYYNSVNGTGTLYVCGNPGGNPTLYQVAISAGALGSVATGPVLANANVACSPLVEYFNTSGSGTDWLFGGVPANSCGATAGSTLGGCVMSYNIGSGTNYGPWMPSYAFPASAEIVDTSGHLQKCTIGCGDTGGSSGTTLPGTWGSTSGATTNDNVVNASAKGTVSTNSATGGATVTIGGLTLTASAPTPAKSPILLSSVPSGGDTITINGTVYDFQAFSFLCQSSPHKCVSDFTLSTSTAASSLNNAIAGTCFNGSCGADPTVTATVNGSTVTVTAITPGTGANSDALSTSDNGAITLNGHSGSGTYNTTLGAGTGTLGTNGSSTAPNFQYWSGSSAVSAAQLAANIAGAITSGEQTANGISLSYSSGNTFFTITGAGSNIAAAGNLVSVGGSLTGFGWTYNSSPTTKLQGGTGIVWTYQNASNGQTTAAAPTGASGLIIDNSGAGTGEANIYFGTLSGTGAQSSAIKMSQNGLQ